MSAAWEITDEEIILVGKAFTALFNGRNGEDWRMRHVRWQKMDDRNRRQYWRMAKKQADKGIETWNELLMMMVTLRMKQ